MKLLKPEGRLPPSGRGNGEQSRNWMTMIVEGQGMGLWTRVRLPPIPLIVLRRDPSKMGGVLSACAEENILK